MVTEIDFDPDPILPVGVSTAATQKLSQRNLAIDHSDNPGTADAHRVQHTFAIHPTTSTPAAGQGPDELMIAWAGVPNGTPASIYLPGVRAAEVLDLANRRFDLQTLSRIDDHTLGCKTAGVTYLPIPAGGTIDLAGLITLDLPLTVRTGELFRIVLRQCGWAGAGRPDRPDSEPRPARGACSPGRHRRRGGATGAPRPGISWGPSSCRSRSGPPARCYRAMSARSSRCGGFSPRSRWRTAWYPVLHRYTEQLGKRIGALGRTAGGPHRPTPRTPKAAVRSGGSTGPNTRARSPASASTGLAISTGSGWIPRTASASSEAAKPMSNGWLTRHGKTASLSSLSPNGKGRAAGEIPRDGSAEDRCRPIARRSVVGDADRHWRREARTARGIGQGYVSVRAKDLGAWSRSGYSAGPD